MNSLHVLRREGCLFIESPFQRKPFRLLALLAFSALLDLSPTCKKQAAHFKVNRLSFYISFNYSARSVKRSKPVAVSSLSKPFKNSATEIFSFWQ